jgi:hypothetical protein
MKSNLMPNGTGTLPCSPAPAGSEGPAIGTKPAIPSLPPGADPAGQVPMRQAWPLSAAPLTLAALPEGAVVGRPVQPRWSRPNGA